MKHSDARSFILSNSGVFPVLDASMSRNISSSTSFSLNILIAFMGSPTYLGSLNLTVFTSPLFLRRRQGMTRFLSILSLAAVREIFQQLHSEFVTFLWVELDAVDVFFFYFCMVVLHRIV